MIQLNLEHKKIAVNQTKTVKILRQMYQNKKITANQTKTVKILRQMLRNKTMLSLNQVRINY